MLNDCEDLVLARAYIKIQHFSQHWEPLVGLLRGTIFPELYRPYHPKNVDEPEVNSYIEEDLAEPTNYHSTRYYREHARPIKKGVTKGGKKSGKR